MMRTEQNRTKLEGCFIKDGKHPTFYGSNILNGIKNKFKKSLRPKAVVIENVHKLMDLD